MTSKKTTLLLFIVLSVLCGTSATAAASPWVLDEDHAVISGRFDFQHANKEFRNEAPAEAFPLEGEFQSTTFETTIRYGVIERFELQMSIPLKQVSYTSDPVILLPGQDNQGLDYYQENVIDLSEQTLGVGDIRLAGRYQLLKGAFATAFEFNIKTPTGYDPPAGTFGNEPKSAQDFKENVGTYVRPDNVEDDVTLGDGQLDLGAEILLGWALPTKTFFRLDAGYKLRLGGAGDQVTGNFQVGQTLGKRVLLKAGTRLAYSVQDGDVIGVSVAAKDPTLPAEDYGGLNNLKLREVPLAYDRLSVNAGVVVRVTEQVETQLSYSRVLWGRNTALSQAVSLGLGVKFDLKARDEDA